MNPAIQGYVDALLEDADAQELRQLADQTAAVAQLVSGSAALRAALTDTALAPQVRRAVMDDLLETRVSVRTRRAVTYAVGAAPAPEVPAALSWLGAEMARAVEDRREPPGRLARAAARQRIGGYATALDQELSLEDLEDLEDALFRFARTVEATAALRAILTDPEVAPEARQGVVDDLVAEKVSPGTRRLLDYVIRVGRARELVATLDWLVDRTAAARGWRVARVRAARDIDEGQRRQLAESLGRMVGAPVDLEVTIDPRLIGGAVVHIGDLQVDASARGRLERLREHMLPGGWEESKVGAPGSTRGSGSHRPEEARG